MRVAAAVDIGATRTKVGLVAEGGRVVRRAAIPTARGGAPETFADAVAGALRPVLAAGAREGELAPGVGVSVAGFLDRDRSMVSYNANLPGLERFPLRRALEERLGVECRLEVDSNAAALAEHAWGAGQGAARLLAVTVGTGLGGGVVLDGRLVRHTGECAGDLGHIILDPSGRRCTCGARGCLEALVCSAALSERAGRRPVREVGRRARRGDPRAVAALAATARWLGIGLASLAPLFDPEVVVVGGGVAASGDLFLEPTRESFSAHAAPAFRDRTRIAGSPFGGWEGMVGAATLFLAPTE